MFNKSGEGLAISTVVYLILALLVLLILVLIFAGEAKSIFSSISLFVSNILGTGNGIQGFAK